MFWDWLVRFMDTSFFALFFVFHAYIVEMQPTFILADVVIRSLLHWSNRVGLTLCWGWCWSLMKSGKNLNTVVFTKFCIKNGRSD